MPAQGRLSLLLSPRTGGVPGWFEAVSIRRRGSEISIDFQTMLRQAKPGIYDLQSHEPVTFRLTGRTLQPSTVFPGNNQQKGWHDEKEMPFLNLPIKVNHDDGWPIWSNRQIRVGYNYVSRSLGFDLKGEEDGQYASAVGAKDDLKLHCGKLVKKPQGSQPRCSYRHSNIAFDPSTFYQIFMISIEAVVEPRIG